MKKIRLFGGYVSKNAKAVFKRVRKKIHKFACASYKRLVFKSVERREHYLVILKNLGCFVKCGSFLQASHKNQNVRFQFPVLCGFQLAYKKNREKIEKAKHKIATHMQKDYTMSL